MPEGASLAPEGELSVDEVVQQIMALEVEEEEDPLYELSNTEEAQVYRKLKPEDRHLFRQFKKFHKMYYEVHGHDAPSHQLAPGIVSQMFSGIPARDADTIANTRAELLVAERPKDLCKKLGLAILMELQSYRPVEAPEYPPPPGLLHFQLCQEKECGRAMEQQQSTEEADVKPDVKPPCRMAMSRRNTVLEKFSNTFDYKGKELSEMADNRIGRLET